MTKHNILFLAAHPYASHPGGLDLQARRGALDQEASAIRKELKLSGYRDRFELVTRWAAEPHDLLRELRELKPVIVHFSGHGSQDGLFFQTAQGDARVVSSTAIAETFGAAGRSVRLVVLSACYSEASVEALLAHVDCVVAMPGVLPDDMARAFAIGFYGALGEQESVAAAYRHGHAAISLEGLPDPDRPQLKVRDGADAACMVLAAITPAVLVTLPCPYPGMRPYSADDAEHFHGRNAEIDELIGRLRAGDREIYVIGPSGSGKSSLVAAGVLPRLARGAAGLGTFVVRSMRPGEHPATRLYELLEVSDREPFVAKDAIAALLTGRPFSSSVLILIDQLEELFTLADTGQREHFLSALETLRAAPRCVIIFTLRADFYGAFMESPLFTDRQGQISRIDVVPLRGKSLSEAIVRPAREVGVSLEPELIGLLLADAGSEPGVLPLLQETLVQLWDQRQGQSLALADYQALGDGVRSGLAVALSRRADSLLRNLTQKQETIARRILLRLTSFGEGRSDTRRQQPSMKLRATDDEPSEFNLVLQRLIDARLLTVDDNAIGETRVDLAHEVMIAAWPTLTGWIQRYRADEQRRRQLETAAHQWIQHGRGARGLLDPAELPDIENWQRSEFSRELGENIEVVELVEASQAARGKRERRRRRLVFGACIIIGIFAIVVIMLVDLARRQVARRQQLLVEVARAAQDALLLTEDLLLGRYRSGVLLSLDRCISVARAAYTSEIEGRCHLAAARVLAQAAHFADAQRELESAMPLLSTEQDLAKLWFERANVMREMSRHTDRRSRILEIYQFKRALDLATKAHDNDLVLAIELSLAQSYAEHGDAGEAERHHARATALDHDKRYESRLAQITAQLAYRRGDLKLAWSLNASLYRRMSPGNERFEVCVLQARISLALDDLGAAQRWAQQGIDEVELIQASQPATELPPWVLASRRSLYELLFASLARVNRIEEAVRVFDRGRALTLIDMVGKQNSSRSLKLSNVARNLQSSKSLPPAVSNAPLLSTDDRGIIEALRSIDLLALTIAGDDLWRLTSRAGHLKIERIGPYESLRNSLDSFFNDPSAPTHAEVAGRLLLTPEAFRDPRTLYVVLDKQLSGLPISALRFLGKPLISTRPVAYLPRLPSKDDVSCIPSNNLGKVMVLGDPQGDLSYARSEAEYIAELLKTTAHINDKANSSRLFESRSHAVLHFAGHIQGNTTGAVLELHDKQISSFDIVTERLGPSLVVLSGCGRGQLDETEFSGSLVTAFLAAGSSQVVAALRAVTDRSAEDLMRRFYKAGGGTDPIRALAAAQAELDSIGNTDWHAFAVFSKGSACPPRKSSNNFE